MFMSIHPVGGLNPLPPSSSLSNTTQLCLHLYALAQGAVAAMGSGENNVNPAPPIDELQTIIDQLTIQGTLPVNALNQLTADFTTIMNAYLNDYQNGNYGAAFQTAKSAAMDIGNVLAQNGFSSSVSLCQNPGDLVDMAYSITYDIYLNSQQGFSENELQQMYAEAIAPIINNPAFQAIKNAPGIQEALNGINQTTSGASGDMSSMLQGIYNDLASSGLLFS